MGFEVYLVNAKHAKNVTGRKDDEDDEGDAEWIQKLHSCRLLQGSFNPTASFEHQNKYKEQNISQLKKTIAKS